MSKIQELLSNLYIRFVRNLSAEFIMAFFFINYIILPQFNIIRSFYNIRISVVILLSLVGALFSMWLIFKCFSSVFEIITLSIFSDFLGKYKKFFSLGALLTKDYPWIFSVYVFLSIISLHLFREFPENPWIHFWYCISVVFRSLFIIPILGYGFIVNINKKQSEIFSENRENISDNIQLNNNLDHNIILFRNTSLVNNIVFCDNFKNWSSWVFNITPSQRSLTIISRNSLLTSCFWYILYDFFNSAINFIALLNQTSLSVHETTQKILEKKQENEWSWIYQELALVLNKKMESNYNACSKYLEKPPFIFTLFYILKWSFFSKILQECLVIEYDLTNLSSNYENKNQDPITFKLLVALTMNYSKENVFALLKQINSTLPLEQETITVRKQEK